MSATVYYDRGGGKDFVLPVLMPEAFQQSCSRYLGDREPDLNKEHLHILYNLESIDGTNKDAWTRLIEELRKHDEVRLFVVY